MLKIRFVHYLYMGILCQKGSRTGRLKPYGSSDALGFTYKLQKQKNMRCGNRRLFVISYTGKKSLPGRLIYLFPLVSWFLPPSLCYSFFLISLFHLFLFSRKRFELNSSMEGSHWTISVHTKYATFHRFPGIAAYVTSISTLKHFEHVQQGLFDLSLYWS